MKNLKLVHTAFIATALLLLLFFLCAAGNKVPILGSALTLLVIFYELYLPLEIIKFYGHSPKDFNIYAHRIESFLDLILPPFKMIKSPDGPGIKKELKSFLLTCLLTIVPYMVFYLLFFKWRAQNSGQQLAISFNLPPHLALEILMQIFLVALPEELFFRGFLQGSLLKQGRSLGISVILTNIIFALGHLANSFSPARLLTFFPGLIFSYLINKNRSLLSPVLFHATCNIVGQILFLSVFLR